MNTERWQQIPELPGIELDEVTGRIRYKAGSPPIIRLRRPMAWVRHGVTDNNLHHKLNGCLAAPPGSLLNRLGQEQADKMARLLYDDLFQTAGETLREYLVHRAVAVWLSPLPRARDTAAAFEAYYYARIRADFPGETFPPLPWEVRDQLKEQCYGILDGLNPDSDADLEGFPAQLKHHYRHLASQWRKLESAVVPWPDGETFVESTLRLKPFLEERSRDAFDGVDIVFAHGIMGNSARVLVGDETLVSATGQFLAIRNDSPPYGKPFWLPTAARS
jgi:broad specificity phosphatase PhoE